MKITDGYVIRNIQGTKYLLPIGQNIAVHRRSLQLNNTGVLIWNALQQGMEEKDLLAYLIQFYQVEETEIPSLQSDIDTFILQLASYRLISRDSETLDCVRYFKIGDLVIGYHGPDHLLHPSLLDFACQPDIVGQHWRIMAQPPEIYPIGEILIRTSDIEILKTSEDYIITSLLTPQFIQVKVSLDGANARFYCDTSFSCDLVEQLFHMFRHAFLIFAQKNGLFALHSSSILYKNKVWLFSAPSGTGKSTQADFWHELYQTPILNGDLNLLSISASTPMVWGLPWCGTSRIYSVNAYPLGGIILLKKHNENTVLEMSKTEKQLSITQRLISPIWTEEMFDCNLDFCGELLEYISVFRYLCRKEPDAAQILKHYIDRLPE